MKIILLGASFNTKNMWVNALVSGIIKLLNDSNKSKKLYIVDYAKDENKYNAYIRSLDSIVSFINIRFSKKIFLKNNILFLIFLSLIIKVFRSKSLTNKVISSNESIKCFYESDYVFSIAGGDSFSDIYGIRNFLYIALPLVLSIILNKKLILLPQTYGPYNTKFAKYIAKNIIKRSSKISSRDYISLDYLKTDLKIKTITQNNFCYDVGFLLPAIDSNKNVEDFLNKIKMRDEVCVGLNVSGLLYSYANKKNNFNLSINYPDVIDKIITNFMKYDNIRVILIPHVFGYSLESDFKICKELYKKYRRLTNNKISFCDSELNHFEVKYLIGKTDFFVGSRMHSCIAAISQGIPAVALAYSRKFIGLYETLESKELVLNLTNINPVEIIDRINNIYYKRTEYHHKLTIKSNEIISFIYREFEKFV